MGVQDVSEHFIVVSDGPLDEDGRPVTVLAKKSAFTEEEKIAVLQHLQANPNLRLVYEAQPSPGPGQYIECLNQESGPCKWLKVPDDVSAAHAATFPFKALIRKVQAEPFVHAYPYNIAPVTDDAPFFFFTMKTGNALRTVLSGSGRGIDWKNNLGIVVLGMLLIISFVAVLAFLVLPLALARGPGRGQGTWPLLYFVAVGLGYILVEVAFIQRFVLFLGHPTYALTVVVFLLLLSSGAGSLTARRWLGDARRVRWVLAGITAGLAALVFLLPRVLGAWIGIPFPAKLAVSALLLIPVGFAMGMPFPTGLRQLAERGQGGVEWAWAMNAGASVLGSALAMAIAIHFGIAATLAAGAVAYLAAGALSRTWRPVSGAGA
jgi:hypothetical protein